MDFRAGTGLCQVMTTAFVDQRVTTRQGRPYSALKSTVIERQTLKFVPLFPLHTSLDNTHDAPASQPRRYY